MADADVWCDNLAEAVSVLAQGAAWVMPHGLVHRLNREASSAVTAGMAPRRAAEGFGYDQRPYPGWVGGGIVILRRDDYQRAPMDPRFAGWGQEDASWALTLDTVLGRHTRLDADLWHLWHPPQPRLNRQVGSTGGEQLWRCYRRAARDRQRMLDLIEEGRTMWPASP